MNPRSSYTKASEFYVEAVANTTKNELFVNIYYLVRGVELLEDRCSIFIFVMNLELNVLRMDKLCDELGNRNEEECETHLY